nr:MAG TPA: Minor Head Virion Protein G6P [Inoviridae sp.]
MQAAFFAILQRLLTYIVVKVFIAIGISFVTFTGFTVGLGFVKDYISNKFNSMPSDILQIIMMAGFGHALGLIFGAFAFNVAMQSISKLSFIPGGGNK